MESKELQRLRPFNQPGATEDFDVTSGARQRHLSLSAARANFDIAKDNMLEEMDHIEDRNRGAVVGPQLRKEYAEIKHSEKKLVKAADELKKEMARSGSNQEISEVDNDVVAIHTRL